MEEKPNRTIEDETPTKKRRMSIVPIQPTSSTNVGRELFFQLRSSASKDGVDYLLSLIDQLESPHVTTSPGFLLLHYHIVRTSDKFNLFHRLVDAELSRKDFITLVKKLLSIGTQLNVRGSFSPLHYACFQGNLRAVEVFIRYGADVNAIDPGGNTPLHTARSCVVFELTQELCFRLIVQGANTTMRNDRGEAPDTNVNVQAAIKRVEEQKIFNQKNLPSLTFFAARAVLKHNLAHDHLPLDCQKMVEDYEENGEAKRFMGMVKPSR